MYAIQVCIIKSISGKGFYCGPFTAEVTHELGGLTFKIVIRSASYLLHAFLLHKLSRVIFVVFHDGVL